MKTLGTLFFALVTILQSGLAQGEAIPFIVGARFDLDFAREYDSSTVLGGELFGQYPLSPALGLELAVGYRSLASSGVGGGYTTATSESQFPVFLGVVYVFGPSKPVRPWLGGGAFLAVSSRTTAFRFRSSESYTSSNATDGGVYLGGGSVFSISGSTAFKVGARYVVSATASYGDSSLARPFLRLHGGFRTSF